MTENDLTNAGLAPSKPFETKELTGVIWMDIQKKTGPDGEYEVRSGSCKINGTEFWINAYEKTTKTGKVILSLTFKAKQLKDENGQVIPF